MARTLVVGNPVVTLEPDRPWIDDGALVVEGRDVTALGARADLEQQGPFDRTVGSTGHAVIPGLVNAHFHCSGFATPGLHEYVWERQNIRVLPGPVDEEALRAIRLLSLARCLRGGQTAVVDFSYGNPFQADLGNTQLLEAYEAIGIRASLVVAIRDRNTLVHTDDSAFLARLTPETAAAVRASTMGYAWPTDEVVALYRKLAGAWDGRDGRIRVLVGPDWTPACSDEAYVTARRLADEFATGLSTHVLETPFEARFNLEHHGRTAMRRLADLGVLGPDVSVAHFVWATDEDIRILADTGAVAVNNPGSNLRLSSGIARVRDILEAGGHVAFGTDSISFSEEEDFLMELRLAGYLQRVPGDIDRGRLPSLDILRGAAAGGAQALRQDDRVGSLAPGREADLVVLDRARLFWPPGKFAGNSPLDVVLDRGTSRDVDSVMVAGRLLLDRGRLTTIDEDAVRETVERAFARRLEPPTEQARQLARLVEDVEPHLLDFYREGSGPPMPPAYRYNAQHPGSGSG